MSFSILFYTNEVAIPTAVPDLQHALIEVQGGDQERGWEN